jgi:hypothetical protein
MTGEAAVPDHIAPKGLTTLFQRTTVEGGYLPKQLFNLDETGLLWRCIPRHTFVYIEEKTTSGFNPFTGYDSMFHHGQTLPPPLLNQTT